MAIPVEKLVIQIGGDATKFKAELKKLKSSTGDFEKTMKNAAIIGKASFVAIGAAATVLGVAATKAFADFETGLIGVAKTADLEGKELEEFSDIILAMSERIPVTTQALLAISTAAGQLGIKGGENIAIFTEVIAKLGKTTDLEGEQAALTIARLINLTNESIKDVDKLGSTLVDLGNNFAATESEILEVAKDVAKATVQFKLSSAEILGISASMASLGIAAEAGGTVIGKAFQAIDQAIRTQGGPAFEKIIELTGLAGEEINQVFAEDAAKVFELFIQGLGEAGREGKDLTKEMGALGLSGIRVAKILPTLSERSDILADSMTRAGIASKDASALNKEAAKAFDTTASKLAIAQTKLNNTLIALGEDIAPDVVMAIEDISDAVKSSKPLWSLLGKTISTVAKGMSNFIKFFSAGIELIEDGSSTVEEFREKNEKGAAEETKFLEKELKKRGISEQTWLKHQRSQRKVSRKARNKATREGQEEITTTVEKGEQKRTLAEGDAQKARAKQLKLSADEKLAIETANLEAIRLANAAEIILLEAIQDGASEDEIQILRDKFTAIKTINDLENAILLASQKTDATAAETEQALHKGRLLEIEQAKFDGIEEKQAAFELASMGSQEDYLEAEGGVEKEWQAHATRLEGIEEDKYTGPNGLLTKQDKFETDSERSWSEHLKKIEKESEGFTGFDPIFEETADQEGFTFTVDAPDTTLAEAFCASRGGSWHAASKTCCSAGYEYDEEAGGCRRKAGAPGTTTDSGDRPGGTTTREERDPGTGKLIYAGPSCAGSGESRTMLVANSFDRPAGFTSARNGSLSVWLQPCCPGLSSSGSGVRCTGTQITSIPITGPGFGDIEGSRNLSMSAASPSGGSSPTFSQIGGTGTGTAGQNKMQLEIFLNGSAAEIINAQIKQGVNLGTIITPK